MQKQFHILLLLFFAGVVYRFLFIYLNPQTFALDQTHYHTIALEMYRHGWYADSIRPYGYPFLISLAYRLFGSIDVYTWRVTQVLMDTATAFLVFFIAIKLFKRENIARLTLVFTLFNPFTPPFTGVLLSEVAATFFLTLSFFLLLLFLQKNSILYAILLGFTLGFLPQVRSSFLFFSVGLVLIISFYIFRFMHTNKKRKYISTCFLTIFFILPFLYNVHVNFLFHKEFAPLTIDNVFVRELYISLFVLRNPFQSVTISRYPPQVTWIYSEYSAVKNAKERKEMTGKYIGYIRKEIYNHPVRFFFERLGKFYFVWEKHYLFPYRDPVIRNKTIKSLYSDVIYLVNLVCVLTGFYGLYCFIKKAKQHQYTLNIWFSGVAGFLFLYISFVHAYSETAERFSLPAYPLLFLFFCYGATSIMKKGLKA